MPRNRYRGYGLHVWHSHICPLEGQSRARVDVDGEKVLPDWVTQDTPYFVYSRKEPPESFDRNPLILRVFVRPCSLCGAKDPFFYIHKYLATDYTEQPTPHDLTAVLSAPPPPVALASPDPACEGPIGRADFVLDYNGPRPSPAELKKILKELPPEPKLEPPELNEQAAQFHQNGVDCICLKCKRQQPKTHRYCVGCGHRLAK